MNLYSLLAPLFPMRPAPAQPRRIVLILPCCIGDVVLATATLSALRRAYPGAHITWAVGSWSKGVVENHPLLNAVLDTGAGVMPLYSPGEFLRFVRQLRAGQFDLAVSLVRSPLMSAALFVSGIPHRAGLDSAGRGFGYTIRVPVDPHSPRHEAEIYLDAARALGVNTTDCLATVPVRDPDVEVVRTILASLGIYDSFFVVNPTGGRNPGMIMDSKRWPPEFFAVLAERLVIRLNAPVVLLGGPDDRDILNAVAERMKSPPPLLAGALTFGQIAALASLSRLYVGNDTGLTHLASAAGAPTVMILGPSDPARYAPFGPRSLALWKPTAVQPGGVSEGAPQRWDWKRDGIGVDEAERKILAFLGLA